MSEVVVVETTTFIKSCKFFFVTEKPCHFLSKLALIITIITTVSLLLNSVFQLGQPTPWLRFLGQYSGATRNIPSSVIVQPTNISHILFGIAGSVATWKDRRHYVESWWDPNSTRGFVWLDDEPGKTILQWSESWPPFRVSENCTRFKNTTSLSAVRIARIVVESFKLGLPNVRWFVMGDDDTVFFTRNLVSVLERYDHRQMYYIGDNSESVEQDVMLSYDMAFGGGGFAISYPLAVELVKVLDDCINKDYTFYVSDQKVWACLSDIGVSLTKEVGFHQLDIRGDPYGLLAAHPVAPLVSLHHLDNINPIFPKQTRIQSLESLIRAYRVDPARIIQQSFCHCHMRNWSLSIAWGYTAQLYPTLVPANELKRPLQTFKTWGNRNGPFTFNTRPIKSDPCEQPFIYFLDRVEKVSKGKGESETLTSYEGKFVFNSGKGCDKLDYAHALAVQRITVIASQMDPEEWNKAPRRHCCEIIDGTSMQNGTLPVRIRKCKSSETVTT